LTLGYKSYHEGTQAMTRNLSREQILRDLDELKREYGDWSSNIPLPFGIWTRGDPGNPHTRLRRIVQAVADLSHKALHECRILDLGCFEGKFSIEFALHGAQTIGVEIREASIKKAIFCKEVLGLENLEFRQDDVRDICAESYGTFDVIICSGVLYHLPAIDAIGLAKIMHDMTNRLVVIDTHVALNPQEQVLHQNDEYWGRTVREHSDESTQEEKATRLWASWDNPTSFWFTRPSLINLISKVGFSSIYECFTPAHLNFGKPGIEHRDRCTFVALKGNVCVLNTSPLANILRENWPEQSLRYW
jgi:SAM-dependent methyltransferase